MYHLDFLVRTPTIQFLRSRNKTFYMWQLFASFVAPDRFNPYPLGTPGDIKAHYRAEYGSCMELYGERYGFDLSGNITFGYVGRAAGFHSEQLRFGAGIAQILDTGALGGLDTFGDAPEDEVGVRAGIALYDRCRSSCTEDDLSAILNQFRAEYVSTLSAQSACPL